MPIRLSPKSSGTPIHPLTRPPPWVSSLKCSKRAETSGMMTGSRLCDDLAGRVVGPAPVEALSEELVEIGKAVSADDDHLVAVDLLDAAAVVGHDLAQFGQDQLEDLRQTQGAVERLGGRAQRLRLLAGGALGLEEPRILDRTGRKGGERLRHPAMLRRVEALPPACRA